MNILANRINNSYNANLRKAVIPNKKKYIFILNKLLKLNCIDYYQINYEKKNITIFLKYYKNKPLFYIYSISKAGNKLFYKNYTLKKKEKFINFFDINLFTSSKEEKIYNFQDLIISGSGGKHIFKIK